jgi:hypothetical protein
MSTFLTLSGRSTSSLAKNGDTCGSDIFTQLGLRSQNGRSLAQSLKLGQHAIVDAQRSGGEIGHMYNIINLGPTPDNQLGLWAIDHAQPGGELMVNPVVQGGSALHQLNNISQYAISPQ